MPKAKSAVSKVLIIFSFLEIPFNCVPWRQISDKKGMLGFFFFIN